MLHYAVVFFVIALIAALFGFGGIAASAVGIAKMLFVVFIVLAIASFLVGIVRRRQPGPENRRTRGARCRGAGANPGCGRYARVC